MNSTTTSSSTITTSRPSTTISSSTSKPMTVTSICVTNSTMTASTSAIKPKARKINPLLWNRLKLCQNQQTNSSIVKKRTEMTIMQNITAERLIRTCNCSQQPRIVKYSMIPTRIQILIASWIAMIGFMGVVAMWMWFRFTIKKLRLSFIPENAYEMEA